MFLIMFMIKQHKKESNAVMGFRLLSLVTLLRKVREGITNEELYKDAERKFDTLIELLRNSYSDHDIPETIEFSMDDFKQGALLIFNRLISSKNSNPYMALCVLSGASPGEIKHRRNMLLQIFHPDRNRENIASDMKTKIINEAYKKIVNEYDEKAGPIKKGVRDMPFYYNYQKKAYQSRRTFFFTVMTAILVFLGFLIILFL